MVLLFFSAEDVASVFSKKNFDSCDHRILCCFNLASVLFKLALTQREYGCVSGSCSHVGFSLHD